MFLEKLISISRNTLYIYKYIYIYIYIYIIYIYIYIYGVYVVCLFCSFNGTRPLLCATRPLSRSDNSRSRTDIAITSQ